jgi:hypothetical protein
MIVCPVWPGFGVQATDTLKAACAWMPLVAELPNETPASNATPETAAATSALFHLDIPCICSSCAVPSVYSGVNVMALFIEQRGRPEIG